MSNVKIWADKAGTGIFNVVADSPPIGTGTFGNPASGLAQITFDTTTYSTNLNDPTTGPLKIDTAARHLNDYFITYDIAPLANPQMTLGVSITSATFVSVSAPNMVSNTNMPETSELRTIIPSPQVMHVDKQYYFSNTNGQLSAAAEIDRAPSRPTTLGHRRHDHRACRRAAISMLDSEVMSYQGITANTLNNVGRCLSGSCDPLNPPAHSTFTFVDNIQVPNYVGMNYTQGNLNEALMKLTLYDETNFNIRWFSLDVSRAVAGGLTGSDADLTAVKVYSGDPYVRDASRRRRHQ